LRIGIPEVGELLGRHLPGATVLEARQVSKAEKFLWRVDGLAQRGLWYWMIADIAEDFTVNWTTALYQSEECRGIEVGGVEREDSASLASADGFGGFFISTVVDEWGDLSHDNLGVDISAGFSADIALTFEAVPGIGDPQNLQAAILYQQGSTQHMFKSPAAWNPETARWEAGVAAHLVGPCHAYWGVHSVGGVTVFIFDAHVLAVERGGPL